jgi:hypothetical protein
MPSPASRRRVDIGNTLNRRGLLITNAPSAGATEFAVGKQGTTSARPWGRESSCAFWLLVGRPSQLEPIFPKPDAPSPIRGPFLGNRLIGHLPNFARQMTANKGGRESDSRTFHMNS